MHLRTGTIHYLSGHRLVFTTFKLQKMASRINSWTTMHSNSWKRWLQCSKRPSCEKNVSCRILRFCSCGAAESIREPFSTARVYSVATMSHAFNVLVLKSLRMRCRFPNCLPTHGNSIRLRSLRRRSVVSYWLSGKTSFASTRQLRQLTAALDRLYQSPEKTCLHSVSLSV